MYTDSGSSLDSVGQRVPSVSLVGTYWAEVIGDGGRELYFARQVQADTDFIVKTLAFTETRAVAALTHYFIWRTRRLNIIGIEQENYRDNTISFRCQEVV